MAQAWAFLLAGLCAGVFSGAMGVGGAIVATPLVRLAGISPHLAVGTTVPAILPAALTGSYTYLRAGLVDKKAALRIAATGGIASFIGAWLTRYVNGHLLMLATAVVLLVVALRLLPQAPRSSPPPDRRSSAYQQLGLGVLAGLFSGLLGIGGGFLIVPVLIRYGCFDTKSALGTSLAAIALMSLPNMAGQAVSGNVQWAAAGLLTLGVIPGARLGAKLAIAAPERRLRLVLGIGLSIAALIYGASELSALSS